MAMKLRRRAWRAAFGDEGREGFEGAVADRVLGGDRPGAVVAALLDEQAEQAPAASRHLERLLERGDCEAGIGRGGRQLEPAVEGRVSLGGLEDQRDERGRASRRVMRTAPLRK